MDQTETPYCGVHLNLSFLRTPCSFAYEKALILEYLPPIPPAVGLRPEKSPFLCRILRLLAITLSIRWKTPKYNEDSKGSGCLSTTTLLFQKLS